MKSPELQQLTASEPLTLEQEYDMQRSWREDDDSKRSTSCHELFRSCLKRPHEFNKNNAFARNLSSFQSALSSSWISSVGQTAVWTRSSAWWEMSTSF